MIVRGSIRSLLSSNNKEQIYDFLLSDVFRGYKFYPFLRKNIDVCVGEVCEMLIREKNEYHLIPQQFREDVKGLLHKIMKREERNNKINEILK